jgi:hypothetical protein
MSTLRNSSHGLSRIRTFRIEGAFGPPFFGRQSAGYAVDFCSVNPVPGHEIE